MARSRRPTQTDIARAADVSPAVVSLVINGRTNGKIRISQETQQRVWEAVRQFGYVPNMAARQLAGGANQVIGVFTYEAVFPIASQNFYYPFLMGIEEQAERSGYDLMLFTRTALHTGKRQIYRDGVNALQVADGAVLVGANEDRAELIRLFDDDYPFVYVGRRDLDGRDLSWVGADYASGVVDLVTRLHDLGHRRVAYVSEHGRNESALDRIAGFERAIQLLGLPTSPLLAEPPEDTVAWVRAALDEGISAFLMENMPRAVAWKAALTDAGFVVPDDLSLVALGDSGEAADNAHAITTFLIPRREMGSGAVALLADQLRNPTVARPHQILLPCTFEPGATIGRPPDSRSRGHRPHPA